MNYELYLPQTYSLDTHMKVNDCLAEAPLAPLDPNLSDNRYEVI